MEKLKKILKVRCLLIVLVLPLMASDCSSTSNTDIARTREIAEGFEQRQPTPTDILYSLERHNLIKRAYWVNGQREQARMLPNPIADMPLGYIILFADNGTIVGRFIVEGKVSSLNSYLTPDSEFYELGGSSTYRNRWLADVDGAYGQNHPTGVFWFTPDGRYLEWTGTYLYSDIPFEVKEPILKIQTQ